MLNEYVDDVDRPGKKDLSKLPLTDQADAYIADAYMRLDGMHWMNLEKCEGSHQ